jgi:hypothetical protein
MGKYSFDIRAFFLEIAIFQKTTLSVGNDLGKKTAFLSLQFQNALDMMKAQKAFYMDNPSVIGYPVEITLSAATPSIKIVPGPVTCWGAD